MHKFFVPYNNINGNTAFIDGEDVKHIRKVLRMQIGDKVLINDCQGGEYLGTISNIDLKNIDLNLSEKLEINNESPLKIHLYQAMPKSTKMDLIIQKCTELGISGITPVNMQRVVVKNGEDSKDRSTRWYKIALEAAKQCKRSIIPSIRNPINFNDMVEELSSYDLLVVPYENEKGLGVKHLSKTLTKSINTIALVVGAEGGFEDIEIDILKEHGAKIVTLGNRILRCETAAITCLSILQYEFGDLGGI